MKPRQPGSRSGLSLFELLIAMALLALIAAGLSGTIGLGLRLNDRTEALAAFHEPLAARRLLRQLLQSALPPNRITPFENRFEDDPNGLSFMTLGGRSLAPDAAALKVSVRVKDQALSLLVEAVDDQGRLSPVLTKTLADAAEGTEILFFDRATDPPNWTDQWDDGDRLPALVSIRIEPGSQPDWPEFTVAPLLGP
jgi:prepilin-type N-terminal cleavage/methylation domain-containing protein